MEIVGYEVVEARILLIMGATRMCDSFYEKETKEAMKNTKVIVNGARYRDLICYT